MKPSRSTIKASAACATAALMVVLTAGPAVAKGPVGVSISGPGLAAPLTIRYDLHGPDSEPRQRLLGRLVDGSGMWQQLAGAEGVSRPSQTRPPGDLGTAYRLSWTIPGLGEVTEADDVIVQDVYVKPGAAPVFFTPHGQPSYSGTTMGGWYVAPPVVSEILTDIGVPSEATSLAAKTAGALADFSRYMRWPLIAGFVAGLWLLLAF